MPGVGSREWGSMSNFFDYYYALPTPYSRFLLRRDAEIVKQEGVSVRRDFELFGGARSAVAGFGLDADQHGRRAALFLLDRRGVFERVRGDHAVVVVGGGDQRRRVFRLFDVVQRRVRVKRLELLGFVRRSVIGDPVPADGELVEAQHVHHAHGRQRNFEKLGPLVQHRADQQPAVRPDLNRQFLRRRVFVGDQPFGGGDEIVEDVLFFQLHPGLVPLLAVFAAAAQVGGGVDEAVFEHRYAQRAERRGHRYVEPAIAVEQRRIIAVELQTFLVNQEHRHARAVLAVIEDLPGFVFVGLVAGDFDRAV